MRLRARAAAAAAGIGGAAVVLALAPVVGQAVSGGGYTPAQQNCSKTANANNAGQPGSSEPSAYSPDGTFANGTPYSGPTCHNITAQVNQGSGDYASSWHIVSVNGNQIPNNSNWTEHAGSVVVDPGQGTAYTVNFDTGLQAVLLFNPLGYAVDLASWLASPNGSPPLPPAPDPAAVKQPSASVSQGPGSGGFNSDNATTWQFYMGADDNMDNGEHDGVNPDFNNGADLPAANGPSDGGAIQANTHPQNGAVDPTDRHDPVKAADAGFGACADGICFGADSTHRKVYQGGCTNTSQCPDTPIYNSENSNNPNYSSGTTNWRSPDCNSGSTFNENECSANYATCPADDDSNVSQDAPDGDCDDASITQPYNERGAYYTDPGVTLYEDPDPQSSPVLNSFPTFGFDAPFVGRVWVFGYPLCELYAGTEGVFVCGNDVVGNAAAAAPSPNGVRHGKPVHSVPGAPTVSAPTQRQATPAAPTPRGLPSTGTLINTATHTLSSATGVQTLGF